MGCFQSKYSDPEAERRNAQIDEQLKQDRLALRNEIKLLLLGAGESGKSTVLRQMRLIYGEAYGDHERYMYREIVWSNAVNSMQVVLQGLDLMGLSLEMPEEIERANTVLSVQDLRDQPALDPRIVEAISFLWKHSSIKQCVAQRNQIQLNDSADYYFNAIERIGKPEYLPTDQDILRSRVKTTGITETAFQVGQLTYRMFDVGGQRSERKKWIHCFENVHVLIFLVALSEYDQTLYEDERVNRMREALTLWQSISSSRWFTETSLVLFLNKVDLFIEKLKKSKISDYFPDYNGPNEFQPASEYFSKLFISLYRPPKADNALYVHFTCATDTKQITVVLNAVNESILATNLKNSALI